MLKSRGGGGGLVQTDRVLSLLLPMIKVGITDLFILYFCVLKAIVFKNCSQKYIYMIQSVKIFYNPFDISSYVCICMVIALYLEF